MTNLYSIVPKFEASDLKNKVCFYGGTFNPWHDGHTVCVQKFLNQATDEDLVILPDHNPWKNSEVMDADHKINILKTIVEKTGHKFIDPKFLLSENKNPTYTWMKQYQRDYPNKSLALLVGFDNFAKIFEWFEAEKLLKLLDRLYIVSRKDNESLKKEVAQKIKTVNNSLQLVFLGHHSFEELSSTALRDE